MKISAIGKRKLPMVFCNDTLWIKDCPQCIDEFNKWHGVAISNNYDVVDSLKLAKDFRVAILSPNFIVGKMLLYLRFALIVSCLLSIKINRRFMIM